MYHVLIYAEKQMLLNSQVVYSNTFKSTCNSFDMIFDFMALIFNLGLQFQFQKAMLYNVISNDLRYAFERIFEYACSRFKSIFSIISV